jgi:nucleoside-diphosphate-sugar epimerase
MKPRNALVTGGAGFVGSHIVDALLERDIGVYVLDDLSTGCQENLAHLKGDPRLTFLKMDVRSINDRGPIPEGIDVVFHEAAIASVPRSVDDPMTVHDINVNASLQVMNFCLKRGVGRFVFASSAAVYGPVLDPPATEDDFCAPGSPYGASKLSVEKYMHAYHSCYGLETVALRYFNIYGPRQRMNDDYSGVIPLFARQLLSSATPIIFGDGMQTRDFVHVRDVAAANILAMMSDAAPGQVFNIASGRTVSILGLLETLTEAAGLDPVTPKFGAARRGDLRVGTSSIEKARRLLGFDPQVSLEDGLLDVLGYLRRATDQGVVAV